MSRLIGSEKSPRLKTIDGVCLDLGVSKSMVRMHFFSPNVSLMNQIANEFVGFTNLASAGFDVTLLQGVLSNRKGDNGSCVLELSTNELSALDPEVFVEIPSLVVKDFIKSVIE